MFPPCKYSDLIYTLFPAIFSFLPEAAAGKSRRSHKFPLLSAGEGKLQDQRNTDRKEKKLLNPSRFCQQKLLRKESRIKPAIAVPATFKISREDPLIKRAGRNTKRYGRTKALSDIFIACPQAFTLLTFAIFPARIVAGATGHVRFEILALPFQTAASKTL